MAHLFSPAKKRVMIVKDSYPLNNDTRVLKITRMLCTSGFDVRYLGWNWQQTQNHISINDLVLNRIKSRFGIYRIILFPIWWAFVFIKLLTNDWDFLHVVNFPSLLPAILIAKLKMKKIVYDIEDVYIDQQVVPTLIRNFVISFDKILMRYVDAIILVDELQKYEFGNIPNKRTVII